MPAVDASAIAPVSRSGPLADGRVHALGDLPLQPWRNGGGQTRPVVSAALQNEPLWRVSAAELQASGPFSAFPGLHRQAMLIAPLATDATPSVLTLMVDGQAHALNQAGEQMAFEGEAQVALRLGGGPARFWNVMTRRGGAQATLRCWRAPALTAMPTLTLPLPHSPLGPPDQVLLVLAGVISVAGPDGATRVLQAGELSLWPQAEALGCLAASPDAIVVQTTLARRAA
ncbi:HutD family protein [Aquabacterium sp.]|uniref:HutD/Ves family protein n=1 Tax=Aquabacterium sp. TaxID=1872578 RepID=UPI0025B9DC1C|nr:HutD family protein [Aquabacterium sp.]